MRLWPRRRVDAEHAGIEFVGIKYQEAWRGWPMVIDDLKLALPDSLKRRPGLLEEDSTRRLFAFASLAVDLHAVRNLVEPALAEQVRHAALHTIRHSRDAGELYYQLVETTSETMNFAVASGTPVTHELGAMLFRLLKLDDVIEVGDRSIPSPVVLSVVGSVPVRLGAGWWKRYLERHRLVLADPPRPYE